jgi:hypothetical protein
MKPKKRMKIRMQVKGILEDFAARLGDNIVVDYPRCDDVETYIDGTAEEKEVERAATKIMEVV